MIQLVIVKTKSKFLLIFLKILSSYLNSRKAIHLVFTLVLGFFLIFLKGSLFQSHFEVKSLTELQADSNDDGRVDGVDYVVWLKNFNKRTLGGKADGDFNLDEVVDSSDYGVWLSEYGKSLEGSTSERVLGTSTTTSFWEKVEKSISGFFSQIKKKILPEPNVISYPDAREYVGKKKTVEGEIKEILNNKRAVYLGFKKPHTGTFVVRILEENWKNFPDIPDKIYKEGQKIHVTGEIKWYQGDPVIYVQDPSQIVVLSE